MAMRTSQLPELFAKYGIIHRVKRGESVYLQEDPADYFYMVKEGTLRSYWMTESGKQITLELLRPGRIFGSVSFFQEMGRIASVTAVTDARIVSIDRETLRSCFGEHYQLAAEIFEMMGSTTAFLVSQVQNLTIPTARQRIAHALIQLTEEELHAKSPAAGKIPYSHQQIAELAGLNRVTATRELNRLREEGWIDLGYRTIAVKNLQKLREMIQE